MAQCQAEVEVRDTYRRTGRGKTGFEMYYITRQCKRMTNAQYCYQHKYKSNLNRPSGERKI